VEQDKHRKVEFWFRITGLDAGTLSRLREAFESQQVQVYDGPRTAIPGAVASIAIQPDFPIQAMADFVRNHEIPEDRFGVYVSMTTESDHDGISVPDHVVDVIRQCGGQLDVSVTVV
jgi:hypothetical protein